MNHRGRTFALALLLSLTSVLAAAPAPAEERRAAATPVIEQFYVESDEQLVPGSKITFTVEGTPGAKASVRIGGIARRIPLKEVEEGVYEGSYTMRSGDQISASTTARATLQRRNRSTSALLRESLGATVGAVAGAAVSVPGTVLPGVVGIESFSATPVDRIEPGAELVFTMNATPGGQATFSIEGVAKDIPMRELNAGQYVGSYTVRRSDKISPTSRVSGMLAVAGRTLRTNLSQSLVIEARRPVIGNLLPKDGDTVSSSGTVSVSGTFDESSGIDPARVTLSVGGKDVTASSVVTPQFFNYRAALEPGTYTAVVSATDRNGKTTRQSWKFTVAGAAAGAGTSTVLPLQVLSHQNMAVIGPGLTEVRGRTAAEATVQVQVRAVSAVLGYFGVAQNLLSQTVQADANGDFSFRFQPLGAKKDMRYEIALTASKGGQSNTASLVLTPQQ